MPTKIGLYADPLAGLCGANPLSVFTCFSLFLTCLQGQALVSLDNSHSRLQVYKGLKESEDRKSWADAKHTNVDPGPA